MNLPNQTLVLVADGRKMLFLRNHGEGAQIDLRLEAHREQDNAASHDQGTDAPGRSFSSVGARRSAMAESRTESIFRTLGWASRWNEYWAGFTTSEA